MKKIVFVDSDGTLKNSKGIISDKTKDVMAKLKDNDVEVVITTGRPRYHALRVKNESNASRYVISSNGAEVYDQVEDKIVYASYLDKKAVLKIAKIVKKYNSRSIMTVDNKEVVDDVAKNNNQVMLDEELKSYLNNHNVKQLFIRSDDTRNAIKTYTAIARVKGVIIANESSFFNDGIVEEKGIWFSVTNENVNKGKAIVELCKHLSIDLNNTYGFGNDYNDTSMFDVVNHSIIMENANEDLKDTSRIVAKSNDEDGVAILLESLFLGKGE